MLNIETTESRETEATEAGQTSVANPRRVTWTGEPLPSRLATI